MSVDGRIRVSVIIPAGFQSPWLPACLRSLAAHAPQSIAHEVLIVLNRAGESIPSFPEFPAAMVLPSPVNLGLAGAVNHGRAAASGELLILLHDDAEVEPGWMEALVETADLHPEAGIIGGKVLAPDGSLPNSGVGMILWSDAETAAKWNSGTAPPSSFDRLRPVDFCGTSSLMVRAATWDSIGGADERFYPLYYVDADLAMSTRRLGQDVLYQPASRVRHRSGSSGNSEWRAFVAGRNRALFRQKWSRELEEEHEPRDVTPAGIIRAAERAESRKRRGPDRGATAPSPESAEARERRALTMEAALYRDYAASLAARLEERERWYRRELEGWSMRGIMRRLYARVVG